ncbi:MAG: ATP-binding cassette domain-containing protein, partial [Candidatus Izemoplasmatales bacterium]
MLNKDVVVLSHIDKIYGENTKFPTQVLYDINLSFEDGTFNSIIGQSGSGKSTLHNILGTLDRPSNGSIEIQGIDT